MYTRIDPYARVNRATVQTGIFTCLGMITSSKSDENAFILHESRFNICLRINRTLLIYSELYIEDF